MTAKTFNIREESDGELLDCREDYSSYTFSSIGANGNNVDFDGLLEAMSPFVD